MLDQLIRRKLIRQEGDDLRVTRKGEAYFADALAIDIAPLRNARRPLCRACLDWSERRTHLAGALGAAILDSLFAKKIAERVTGSRTVRFRREGEARFESLICG